MQETVFVHENWRGFSTNPFWLTRKILNKKALMCQLSIGSYPLHTSRFQSLCCVCCCHHLSHLIISSHNKRTHEKATHLCFALGIHWNHHSGMSSIPRVAVPAWLADENQGRPSGRERRGRVDGERSPPRKWRAAETTQYCPYIGGRPWL